MMSVCSCNGGTIDYSRGLHPDLASPAASAGIQVPPGLMASEIPRPTAHTALPDDAAAAGNDATLSRTTQPPSNSTENCGEPFVLIAVIVSARSSPT